MKALYLLFSVVVIISLIGNVDGRRFLKIDNFFQSGPPAVLSLIYDQPDTYWFTPYYNPNNPGYGYSPGLLPIAQRHNVAGAIGGQRDLVVGYEGASPAGSVAAMSIARQRASIGFPENFVGGAYMQWDGDDFGSDVPSSDPCPGCFLNVMPGIGAVQNVTPFPEFNNDGRSVDFTSGGSAFGIFIDITTDHNDTNYYMDVFDINSRYAQFYWQVDSIVVDGEALPVAFFNRYSNFDASPGFDWTRVVGFQVRLWTFTTAVGGGTEANQAVDSSFAFLFTFGYVISGSVELDCNCNDPNDAKTIVVGESVTLRQGSSPSGTVLATGFSDNNGQFEFVGNFLTEGSLYTVCLSDLSKPRCAPATGCTTVQLLGLADPLPVVFTLTALSELFPPPDRTIECGDCETTSCLGTASLVDCSGSNIPVTTFQDRSTGTCPEVISRTFTSGSQSVVQTITVRDTQPPVITVPASNSIQSCGGGTPTLTQWINTNAGAQATDCNGVLWSNNWDGNQLGGCSSVSVTFVATDACGNTAASSRTTATYSVNDSTPPVIGTEATNGQSECNQNGSDFTALNTWLTNNGGARATDNCVTITWTNNYNAQNDPFVRSCSTSKLITFTVRDLCGNIDTTQATYTFLDSSPPTITTPASSQSGECSSSEGAFTNWLNVRGGAVASDVCQPSTNLIWSNNFSGSIPAGCNAVATVTFTVTDGCGVSNSRSTTATFTVTDTQPPVISTPARDLSVNCNDPSSGNALTNWLNSFGGAVATDLCTSVSWTNNYNALTADCAATTVTFTVTDACATVPGITGTHTARTTAVYRIQDNEAPQFSVLPQNRQIECASSNVNTEFTAWLNSNAGAIPSDNCASPSELLVSNNWPVGTFPPSSSCLSVNTVTFTIRDPCGNSSPPATATFTVSDNVPPVINPFASDDAIECQSGQNSLYSQWVSSRGGAQATDACTAVTWSNNAPAQPVFDGCLGITTVTFTATDACARTSVTIADFTITDSQSPTITTQAQDRTDQCTGTNQSSSLDSWLTSRGGAQATDTCSAVTWTNNFVSLTGDCTQVATVTFTARDACGRSSSTVATYTLTDSLGPTITTPARNLVVPCDENTISELRNWVNNNGFAVATDQCDPTSVFWVPQVVDDVIGCNFVTVTFTVFDGCGLSSSTTATFTSSDTDAPTFNPPASDITIECNGFGNTQEYNTWVATHGGAVAFDECALQFIWTSNAPPSGPVGCGAQSVTFTVTDECNNSASTTAVYRVVDTDAPSIVEEPSDLVVECDGLGNNDDLQPWLNIYGGAEAVDACTTEILLRWSYVAGAPSNDGCGNERTYTFTVEDSCANRATATALFVIVDFEAPVFIEPVEDLVVECDGNGNISEIQAWIADNGSARAVDECQATVVWLHDYPGSGPLPCTSQLVTFVVDDGCGNAVSDTGLIDVRDDSQPVFDFFPQDWELPCDADTSVEALGVPIARDVCYGNVPVTLFETAVDEPPVGNCPGDHVITREWLAVDECGNSVTQDQTIVVNIVRSSGPCNPEGCECDECCPPPVASDCIAVPCEAAQCNPVPCQASACSCQLNNQQTNFMALPEDLVEPLPQCKPVYIYVNDDDDSEPSTEDGAVATAKLTLVTNQPIHENKLRNVSAASFLSVSFLLLSILVLLI